MAKVCSGVKKKIKNHAKKVMYNPIIIFLS